MQKAGWIAGGITLTADIATKMALKTANITLIPGIVALRGTQNTGMAFGLLGGHPILLAVVSALLLTGFVFLIRKWKMSALASASLGMLLGGAVGNLLERVLRGSVTDFIEPLFANLFVFNIADCGVVIGAILLSVCFLTGKDEK